MGDYGIKITKPTKDITSTEIRDYQFWDKYPIMKTYLVGTSTYTFTSNPSSVTITITHNLGHPKCVWFSYDGSGTNPIWKGTDFFFHLNVTANGGYIRMWRAESDVNVIRIQYYNTNSGTPSWDATGEVWNFKYYIFNEDST